MPDIVRLRYVGAGTVTVPVIGKEVKTDCLIDFPGRILTEHPADGPDGEPLPVAEDADYWLIEAGNPAQVRAWPKSLWANETAATTAPKPKG